MAAQRRGSPALQSGGIPLPYASGGAGSPDGGPFPSAPPCRAALALTSRKGTAPSGSSPSRAPPTPSSKLSR